MHLVTLLAVSLLPQLPYALSIPSRRAVKCSFATSPDSGQTCSAFASDWSMTENELKSLNPGIKCPDIDSDSSYCVDGTVNNDEPTGVVSKTTEPTSARGPPPNKIPAAPSAAKSITKSTVPQKPSPTDGASGNSIQTPNPIQEGMVVSCNKFHYVNPTTTCQGILDHYKISLAQFINWNPAVGKDCSNLWKGTNACVGVIGFTPSPSTNTKPNPAAIPTGNGVTTPSPIQAGMVKNCVKFHYIGTGTTCHGVLHHDKITMAQFAKWNPAVGNDCSSLWKDTYACVAVA